MSSDRTDPAAVTAAAGDARHRALLLLTALETDLDMLVDVLDTARSQWSPDRLRAWLFTSQIRWGGRSPIDMIIANKGEAVLDILDEADGD
jgi:hypothetical protein